MIFFTLFLTVLSPFASLAGPLPTNPWSRVSAPTKSAAEAIGGYSAGCLSGAVALTQSSPHHELMRISRRRNYGHPDLIRYVEALATFAGTRFGRKLLVGDLAQSRGGPTLSNHLSHQNGLDADIWLWLLPKNRKLAERDRERLHAPDVVNHKRKELNREWQPYMAELIRFSAARPEVERVLVNPAIKRKLCQETQGERAWLAKVRPWYGHSDHIHVRLACPKGSSACEAQPPAAEDEDCGENLAWWWSKEAEEELAKLRARLASPEMPVLPARCQGVLREP